MTFITRDPALESRVRTALIRFLPDNVSLNAGMDIVVDGRILYQFQGLDTTAPNSPHGFHRMTWSNGLCGDVSPKDDSSETRLAWAIADRMKSKHRVKKVKRARK